jgi:hypothetical protein
MIFLLQQHQYSAICAHCLIFAHQCHWASPIQLRPGRRKLTVAEVGKNQTTLTEWLSSMGRVATLVFADDTTTSW